MMHSLMCPKKDFIKSICMVQRTIPVDYALLDELQRGFYKKIEIGGSRSKIQHFEIVDTCVMFGH